jgi:hypothetical protein
MTRSDIEQSIKEVRDVINALFELICGLDPHDDKRIKYEEALWSSYACESRLAKQLTAMNNA